MKTDKRKLLAILLVVGTVVLIGAIWGLVALSTGGSKTPAEEDTSTVSRLTGATLDEDKKSVVTSADELLNAFRTSDLEATLEKLDSNDTSEVPKLAADAIRWSGAYDESEDLKVNVYQALYTFNSLINEHNGSETIAPTTDTLWKDVFVDQEAGVAYVPSSIYLGDSAYFELEFYFVEGQWKLAPYSLMAQIRLSAAAGASTAAEAVE